MPHTPSRRIPLTSRQAWLRRPPWWLVASGALVLYLAGAGWITCRRLSNLPAAGAVDVPLVLSPPQRHDG